MSGLYLCIFRLVEIAELLCWSRANFSTKFKIQWDEGKVKNQLSEPVHIYAATPVWTLEQAEKYKKLLKIRHFIKIYEVE